MTEGRLFPQEVIRRKRDGAALSDGEIAFMVRGIADGSISEGQVAAFAMAVLWRGMAMDERVALTREMARSGATLDWPGLGGPVLDKHSTGGVGDKVSLVLAPIVAACGGFVPMISGRGLGHTGGTLDKLDSIPGYDTAPGLDAFRRVVRDAGCAIIGATADLAPADRRLYAIRDVTATVESIALITASILSKKLAAGLDRLVMDVKFGSGAFAAGFDAAVELAESIVAVAGRAGLECRALITDMNQVLGRTAGNALEVREAIEHLTGARRDDRLHEVAASLSGELLVMAGLAADANAARRAVDEALASGRAAERFARMVAALGGPADLIEGADRHLPRAPVEFPATPERAGVVAAVDARRLGVVVMELGGARRTADDRIDPAVGLTHVSGIGESVGPDRPLCVVHARGEAAASRAADGVRAAVSVGDEAAQSGPVVRRRIGGDP